MSLTSFAGSTDSYHQLQVITKLSPTSQLHSPVDVTFDDAENLYVADVAKRAIIKLDTTGKFVDSWRHAGEDILVSPSRITIHNQTLYVADRYEAKIYRFGLDGEPLGSFGERGNRTGQLSEILGLCISPEGYVFAADHNRDRILKFSGSGEFQSEFGRKGETKGAFFGITDIACSNDGYIFVSDFNNVIQKFSTEGKFVKAWGRKGSQQGQVDDVLGLAMDEKGNLLISDTGNGRIQRLTTQNGSMKLFLLPLHMPVDETKKDEEKTSTIQTFKRPMGLAVSKSGRLVIADPATGMLSLWSSLPPQ